MKFNEDMSFVEYAKWWIQNYKEKEVRQTTLQKYYVYVNFVEKNALDVPIKHLTREHFQKIVDSYAIDRTEGTVRDFVTNHKAMLRDLVYEKIIDKDPTHRVTVWGGLKTGRTKSKFLSLYQVEKLVNEINLSEKNQKLNRYLMNWLIYLGIKTGVRFSEALAITEFDIDFNEEHLRINKTWNYKNPKVGGYLTTKSKTSIRNIPLDKTTLFLLKTYIKNNHIKKGHPLFNRITVHNSTINEHLERLCKRAEIPIITFHSLRHTYTSLNLAAGVSLQTVSKNLGHSDTIMTQRVYSHVIEELAEKDNRITNKLLGGF